MQQNGRQHNGRQRVHKRHLQTASGGAPPGLQQFEPDQMQHPASGYKQAKVSPDAKSAVQPSAMNGGSLQQTRTSSTTRAHLTDVHFNSLAICEPTKRALAQVLKYDVCTKVQAQSIPACLDGTDIVCKAKTGTGKTLAFLIPSLQRMQAGSGRGVSALIISPTRELAQQIAAEATSLGTFHKLNVQCVVGGTNADSEARKMARNIPNILVATPGRLVDHLQNHGASKFVSQIDTFVLDEADRLLDMGFRKDLDKILALLPDKTARQTLLFSATFPSDIQQLAKFALKPNFKVIDTVGEETNTSTQVKQSAMILPMQNMTAQLLYLLAEHRATDPDHKILVFCTTARLTQLYAQLCGAIGMNVLEIHSRKSQSHRTKVANQFREGSGVTMFTSDVSARGVDYPDVSLVLQVGMPSEQSQYIHRIGRTARAGKQGQAILLLHDFEEFFMQSLKGLPVEQMQPSSEQVLAPYEAKAQEALRHVPEDSKGAAYQAWLGFYNSSLRKLRWSSEHLVQQANLFSATIGCTSPPALQKSTVGKMGLKGVPGINFASPGSVQNRRQQGEQRGNAQQAYDGGSQGQQAQGQAAGPGRGGRGGGGRGRGGNAGGRGGRGGRGGGGGGGRGGGGGQQERGSQNARDLAW